MTLTFLDLYNTCASQEWSMYNNDATDKSDFEASLVIDLNKAVTEISEAIDITKEEAETQVNGFKYPDGAEQLTDAYFGADGESGEIAQILKKSADFLVEQGSIDSAPELSVFEEYSTGEYILRAMNE